ncbi:AAA family ATPase [Vibrio cyclitrophicus]
MKITSLIVGGFKGIKNKATIPLAPITLFFGANSTGKSTVLHALLYLYEVVAKRNFDAQFSSIAGESLYFGGFQNIVHKQSLEEVITIGASIDFGDDGSELWHDFMSETESLLCQEVLGFTPNSTADRFSFELDVAWDSQHEKPFVKRFECMSDGVTYLLFEAQAGRSSASISHYEPLPHWDVDESFKTENMFESGFWEAVPIRGNNALPDVEKRIDLSRVPFDWEEVHGDEHSAAQVFSEASLSQASLAPLRILTKQIKNMLHIGPLRVVPSRNEVIREIVSTSRWYSGHGAWDTFGYGGTQLHECVNRYFQDEMFLNYSYQFGVEAMGDYPLQERRVLLKMNDDEVKLLPSQVGVGVSQVFPFVVATSLQQDLIVSCEQPELHIHPKWQLVLGDMMIEAIKNNPERMFLIETHSEHLMLRLLRRTIDEGVLSIKPDDVSVINVFKHDNEIHYQRQRITEAGDFELDWPEGFFEERYGES